MKPRSCPDRVKKRAKLGLAAVCVVLSGCEGWAVEKQPPPEPKAVPAPSELPKAVSGEGNSRSEVENLAPVAVRRADYAITKIEFEKAQELLEGEVGPDAARARARLAVYRADCEGALAHLASTAAREARGAAELFDLASRCRGATAGSVLIEDEKAGVWIRIQDEADRVLAPLLTDVAVRARTALEKDLGVVMPRPLRIDLVRDLFSLSAVSGLPVESAETTGTVAIARWGRVTMVSPRAMSRGFPWADTLAHEITHLLLSRATADRAPLWLQEGIAKREEHRWRDVQAFDDVPDFAKEAYKAQVSGKAVGVDAIGPSIAMLPSAEAASIAFAEVTAFMQYWIARNGPHALSLLLRELEITQDAESAMRSVSGYGVAEWQLLWRGALEESFEGPEISEETQPSERLGPRALGRVMRLTELLTVEGFAAEGAELAAPELDRASHSAAYRFLAGRAALLSGRDDAELLLGQLDDVDGPHAGWLALYGASAWTESSHLGAEGIFQQAVGLDPLLPEVACRGKILVGNEPTLRSDVSLLEGPDRDLCEHAKTLPVRGGR